MDGRVTGRQFARWTGPLELPMRVRQHGDDPQRCAARRSLAVVRVPEDRRGRCALDEARADADGREAAADIRRVGIDGEAVHKPEMPRLEELWRPRDHGLRAVARLRVVPRRHGRETGGPSVDRPHRQFARLRARQLPMGRRQDAGEEQEEQSANDAGWRNNADVRVGRADWDSGHCDRPTCVLRMVRQARAN